MRDEIEYLLYLMEPNAGEVIIGFLVSLPNSLSLFDCV